MLEKIFYTATDLILVYIFRMMGFIFKILFMLPLHRSAAAAADLCLLTSPVLILRLGGLYRVTTCDSITLCRLDWRGSTSPASPSGGRGTEGLSCSRWDFVINVPGISGSTTVLLLAPVKQRLATWWDWRCDAWLRVVVPAGAVGRERIGPYPGHWQKNLCYSILWKPSTAVSVASRLLIVFLSVSLSQFFSKLKPALGAAAGRGETSEESD